MIKIEENHFAIETDKIKGQIKLLVLSDFHFNIKTDSLFLKFLVNNIRSIIKKNKPDLILLAGDYINDDQGLELIPQVFKELTLDHRVLAVLGNHDYFSFPLWHLFFFPFLRKIKRKPINTTKIECLMKENSIELLNNRNVCCRIGEDELNIIGVDPLIHYNRTSFPEFSIGNGFNIVLSHYPDILKNLDQRIDLLIAGHTHGGIFHILGCPVYRGTELPLKKPYGQHCIYNKTIIITKGIQAQKGIRYKLSGEPDISIIKIKSKEV
ncbi:MAG: hypothetical protein GY756_12810 [bacterium]|nr:hypothetical protein [bacterium]